MIPTSIKPFGEIEEKRLSIHEPKILLYRDGKDYFKPIAVNHWWKTMLVTETNYLTTNNKIVRISPIEAMSIFSPYIFYLNPPEGKGGQKCFGIF